MGPELDDEALLAAIDRVWQVADPAPDDLAAGVLARIAVRDLEVELLTLVSAGEGLAGVRSAGAPGEAGETALEFAGPGLRVVLRIDRRGTRARVDGWLVPAGPMTVRLSSAVTGRTTGLATVDEHGRFDLLDVPLGECRLTFTEGSPTGRARATEPFRI